MSLRIASRRFAPTLFGVVLTVVGIALFVRLGFWQLHRADEKHALIAAYEAGARSTADLTTTNVGSLPRYQHVRARGHYDPAHQILLDNMPSEHGQAGFRVVTPFELEQGGWVLVDRGWIAMGVTRTDLPNIAVGSASRTVTGRLDGLPRAGIELAGAAADANAHWPRIMSFPPHGAVERALGHPLHTGLILLDADQPEGYERAWHAHFNVGADRHIAYAVQWFAFAVTALVMFFLLSLRREQDDERAVDPA